MCFHVTCACVRQMSSETLLKLPYNDEYYFDILLYVIIIICNYDKAQKKLYSTYSCDVNNIYWWFLFGIKTFIGFLSFLLVNMYTSFILESISKPNFNF